MCVWKGGGEESVCVYGRVWGGKGECVEEGGGKQGPSKEQSTERELSAKSQGRNMATLI